MLKFELDLRECDFFLLQCVSLVLDIGRHLFIYCAKTSTWFRDFGWLYINNVLTTLIIRSLLNCKYIDRNWALQRSKTIQRFLVYYIGGVPLHRSIGSKEFWKEFWTEQTTSSCTNGTKEAIPSKIKSPAWKGRAYRHTRYINELVDLEKEKID